MIRFGALATALATVVAASAQTPSTPSPDATAYTVAYVDVAPASRQEAIAAFKNYREASRQETGFRQINVFEQIGRAGHFAIIEAWTDANALEAHGAASSATTMRDTMKRVGVSGYDERPQKSLSVAAPRAAGGGQAVHVVTHVDVIPNPTAAGIVQRLAEASRNEPGNLRFDVLVHAMRANHFTLVESWASQAAADAHAAAAHTRQYRAEIQPLSGSPVDERLFKRVD